MRKSSIDTANIRSHRARTREQLSGLCSEWTRAALIALEQGQDINNFVLHCHPDNRSKAVKAYKQMQRQIRYGCIKASNL